MAMAAGVLVLPDLEVGCWAAQLTREVSTAALWVPTAFLVPTAFWGKAAFWLLVELGVGWWGDELEEGMLAPQIVEGLL